MSSESRFPAQLPGDQHRPTQRIRCPIHGFIKYSESEREVINHSAFQRLRHVKQLSFTYYLYPGATHTRFEHSLGVMELVTRAFDTLCFKNGKVLEKELRHVRELKQNTLPGARQVLRLLALFHDIGHTPFSHAGEIGGKDHEDLALDVVQSKFRKKLGTWFFKGCAELVCELMAKDVRSVRQHLLILHNIIKGQVDMDRTDYLARDSHHCGVEYGVFDQARLVESLNLTRDNQGNLALCVEQGGFHTVEALLLARYQINLQVYYHRVRRIYDCYLARFLDAWISQAKEVSVEEFWHSDDLAVFEAIRHHAENKESPAHQWARRLVDREHHRMVLERGDFADANDEIRAKKLVEEARKRYKGWDFILDKGTGSVHKLFVPGDQEKVDDFFVLDTRTGHVESIGERSRIIEKIPKSFCVLRVFASPIRGSVCSAGSKKMLKKIEDWCRSSFGS